MQQAGPQGLKMKILANKYQRAVFSEGGDDVFLVGGYLRELIARGQSSLDLDYLVVGDVRALIRRVMGAVGGRVVELKDERLMRLVLPRGRTLDFTALKGSLAEDLRGRDFTVNAMAWSPSGGLIDPHCGLDDIRVGIIRGVLRKNFLSDPLRLLRAYRFAAQYAPWRIEPRTRLILKQLSGRITRAASERITLEFFRLLSAPTPGYALRHALNDGILSKIIPLNNNKLRQNIKLITQVDETLEKLHKKYFIKKFPYGLGYYGLMRLQRLASGASPDSLRLSPGNEVLGRLRAVESLLLEGFEGISGLGPAERFELYAKAGPAAPDLLVLVQHTWLLSDWERFVRIMDKSLLSSKEIMALSGLGPGPALGRLLRSMRKMQFERTIKGPGSARRWLSHR